MSQMGVTWARWVSDERRLGELKLFGQIRIVVVSTVTDTIPIEVRSTILLTSNALLEL